jgi:hypothetical protein
MDWLNVIFRSRLFGTSMKIFRVAALFIIAEPSDLPFMLTQRCSLTL